MSSQKALSKIKELAKTIRAEIYISDSYRFVSIDVEAPKGNVWSANFGHIISCGAYVRFSEDDLEDVLKLMKMGVENCHQKDCDFCEEN